jgi:hypothetical protein
MEVDFQASHVPAWASTRRELIDASERVRFWRAEETPEAPAVLVPPTNFVFPERDLPPVAQVDIPPHLAGPDPGDVTPPPAEGEMSQDQAATLGTGAPPATAGGDSRTVSEAGTVVDQTSRRSPPSSPEHDVTASASAQSMGTELGSVTDGLASVEIDEVDEVDAVAARTEALRLASRPEADPTGEPSTTAPGATSSD